MRSPWIRAAETVLALSCSLPLFGAPQQAPPPLTQEIEVSVVNVDVSVLDRAGRPVSNLTKDDFEVFEDGAKQTITNFSVVTSTQSKRETQFETDPERRRSVVVIIDDRGTRLWLAKAIAALGKSVNSASDDANWSIISLAYGARTVLPFTSDKAAVLAALDRVAHGTAPLKSSPVPLGSDERYSNSPLGDFGNGVRTASDIRTGSSIISVVIHTARGLAWIPGKKIILLVSSEVPGYLFPGNGEGAEAALLHQQMVEEANAANASVSVLDPLGVGGDFENAHHSTSAAVWLASLTGGLFLPSNDPVQSVEKLDVATTNYYDLGYHTSSSFGTYHHIKVRLKEQRGYTVTHREGYLRLSREGAFERAMLTPFGIASLTATLPVSLSFGPVARSELPIHATIPLGQTLFLRRGESDVGRLHVYVTAFDADGDSVAYRHFVETITHSEITRQSDLDVSTELPLKPGHYRVFVTVRDELSGEVGVVEQDVAF